MKRRGLLIPCLLLLTLMLILCIAQLGRQPFHYQAARSSALAAQARALAESGLEDFRSKWSRDPNFPPEPPAGISLFTYSDDIFDPDTWLLQGSYRVTCEIRYRSAPYQLLLVRSQGILGGTSDLVSSYTIEATLDISDGPRPQGPSRLGEWLEWRELPPPLGW